MKYIKLYVLVAFIAISCKSVQEANTVLQKPVTVEVDTREIQGGMWIPSLLEGVNEAEMMQLGSKMTAKDIYDVNNSALKEFDVQTNEFGSFSGEFDIPKNTLTGEFSIEIEEPKNYEQDSKYYNKKEDEHEFWDNVDFESYNEFKFKVEEYKRPTFEVNFDEIKENYTIGNTINIKGNAKALAGNNLTNAKISYTVSKNCYSKTKSIPYQQNFINSETATDENGNFTIQFIANEPTIANEEIETLNFSINVTVTDIQGETRSASQSIVVGKEMLKLNLKVNWELISEDNNKLNISATTLNNYPIDTKGKIKIYELKKKSFLKKRQNDIPEIQTLTKNEFQNLFQHEPFDETDEEVQEILVKTISFDTKISKEIALDFLKNYRNSNFKIVAEAYDSKNNLITNQREISVKSKQFPYSEKELFTYKDISESKSKDYTIEIQSIIPDLYITSRLYVDENMTNDVKTIQLINGKAIFKFNKDLKFINNITFHFSTIWENEGYQKLHQIKNNTTENKLQIEIESLRNKIEPGSTENWSFKITNPKLQAEILASMYDSSLDQFKKSMWEDLNFETTNFNNFQVNVKKNNASNFYIENFNFNNVFLVF